MSTRTDAAYLFAGGGTGGHLYPGLAVAEELLRLRPDAKLVFACSSRLIDRKILDPLPYAIVPQPVRPLPRRPWEALSFLRAWRASRALARDLVGDLRPAAVLGLGGFAAGPVVREASNQGVPSALLNPDAVPGKANQYLSQHVDAIFVQFASTRDSFAPTIRDKVRHVGCPIRSGLLGGDRAAAVREFGLREDRKTLLVFGGSLLAESISEAVGALAVDLGPLAGQWQVLHISGSPKAGRIESELSAAGLHVRTLAYCQRMDLAYATADVCLCRSGAVTVAELAATGTPAVAMPYPHHKDQQQKLNAMGLSQARAAVICEDASEPSANAARLRELLLPLMRDEHRLAEMSQAALGLGKPDAAREVAQWLAER